MRFKDFELVLPPSIRLPLAKRRYRSQSIQRALSDVHSPFNQSLSPWGQSAASVHSVYMLVHAVINANPGDDKRQFLNEIDRLTQGFVSTGITKVELARIIQTLATKQETARLGTALQTTMAGYNATSDIIKPLKYAIKEKERIDEVRLKALAEQFAVAAIEEIARDEGQRTATIRKYTAKIPLIGAVAVSFMKTPEKVRHQIIQDGMGVNWDFRNALMDQWDIAKARLFLSSAQNDAKALRKALYAVATPMGNLTPERRAMSLAAGKMLMALDA